PISRPHTSTLFPYTTLFRSLTIIAHEHFQRIIDDANRPESIIRSGVVIGRDIPIAKKEVVETKPKIYDQVEDEIGVMLLGEEERSEEHTSELQSRENLVCRL